MLDKIKMLLYYPNITMMESSKQQIFQESRRVVRAGITAVESVPEYLRAATQTLKALTYISDYTCMGTHL